jgi:catechol 2,3-dioxygenase-like lactoylglutathione lyase family enzyme/limonene-1,2-epoxide hydrolase
MVKKADAVSVDAFRQYMTDSFAVAVIQSDSVLKLRLHLFEQVDNSRPDAAGVSHYEPLEKQYQAAFEIAFSNPLEMEKFFASKEYATAVKNQAEYVKQINPFPERSAYTFVYDGQMTLAGQRSSKVADLIAKLGATNQLKKDVVSLMSGKQSVKSGLGHYLQGVQHVGVTVHDMAKSLEFYIDVLGGKLAIAENDLVGDGMQNTLFQKEELDAITQGVDPKNFDIPNLRDAKEALDVKFISFGNACIELIYFKNAATPNAPTTSSGSIPSNIGHVNAMHISFHVKDDVDLNVFAKMLEEECQKRGLTNVVFNRVIRVKSEEERRNIALKYNSNKFWDEPDLLAEDQPEADFGEFEGWALFYCKGPNGEQLEFNQVTRKAKGHFAKAQEEYNMANGTSFAVSEAKVSSMNATQERAISERLYATFSSPVNASLKTAWNVLLDKIENPGRYNPEAQDYKILEKHGNEVLREMKALNMTIKERIAWDEKTLEIRHTLVHNPLFMGQIINTIVPPTSNNPNDLPTITYTLDWEPYNNEARHVAQEIQEKLTQAVQQSVLNSKTVAEQQDAQKESRFAVSDAKVEATTIKSIDNKGVIMSEQLQAVVQLSESVLKEDWEQVKPFLTEDILYKVGSAEPVYGKQSVVAFLSSMFANTAKFTGHEIRKIWNEPGIIVVEMDAKYTTVKDKKHLTIACCDIYRMRGNQVSEWRVYADILPFYQTDLQEQQTQQMGREINSSPVLA